MRSQRRASILFLSFLSAAIWDHATVSSNLFAQVEEGEGPLAAKNLEDQIKGIKNQIDTRRKQLAEVLKKQAVLQDQLREISSKQERVQRGQEKLRSELAGLDRQKSESEAELGRELSRLKMLEQEFRERLVANYKMLNQASGISYLASANSATDLLRRTVYLARISQRDEAGVSELEKQVDVVKKEKILLDGISTRRKAQLESINEYAKQLEENEKEKRQVFDRMQAEARGHESELAKLKRKELELEALLESLTGGEEPTETPPQNLPPEVVRSEEPVTVPPILDKPKPFLGKGLEPLRGQLLFPVSGRLIHAFGMQRHEEFSELLFHKGVEMDVAESSSVQVIASGKVVVEQELPGIGLTLIVDHGDRYYSLYGRLRQSLKHRGQEVQRGEAIGKIGAPGTQGKNFYFELRYRGKAINPESFFKNLPSS